MLQRSFFQLHLPKRYFYLGQKGLFRLFGLALSLSIFLNCKAPPEALRETARENFELGQKSLRARKFEKATEAFEQARLTDPSSRWAVKSQLGLADTLFSQSDFVGAAERYRIFIEEHPYHERTTDGYCAFMIGKSYYLKIPKPHWYAPPVYERDLGDIEDAEVKLVEFLRIFPQNSYVAEAKTMHAAILKLLVEHELYVARYYLKHKKITAAQWRLEFARDRYMNSPLEADVLFLLGEVYLKQNQTVSARDTFLALQSRHPTDPHIKKVESYLEEIKRTLPNSATLGIAS